MRPFYHSSLFVELFGISTNRYYGRSVFTNTISSNSQSHQFYPRYAFPVMVHWNRIVSDTILPNANIL